MGLLVALGRSKGIFALEGIQGIQGIQGGCAGSMGASRTKGSNRRDNSPLSLPIGSKGCIGYYVFFQFNLASDYGAASGSILASLLVLHFHPPAPGPKNA